MQQQAFPYQYLRSRQEPCALSYTCIYYTTEMQMCNAQIDNFDWIKMKGQLRLVIRIEHCSILKGKKTSVEQLL